MKGSEWNVRELKGSEWNLNEMRAK